MHTAASGNDPQRAREIGKRVPKTNKSCVPCRERKVKCNAAVVGIPCSSCISRQCAEDCELLARKGRTRKTRHVSQSSSSSTRVPATPNSGQSNGSHPSYQSAPAKTPLPSPLNCQSPLQAGSDLLYLNILNDTVKETTGSSQQNTASNTPCHQISEDGCAHQNGPWTKIPHLDDADNEYLVKKGVFDLPAPRHLDAFIKAYFDHLYPFAPVINRHDFIRTYESGNPSAFLLYAMLTTASVYAPTDMLLACGFAGRSEAQESFFSKAKLLHDFTVEQDPLLMLQGSIILCMVITDHPTDADFSYWFHNAVRLATKLDLRNICIQKEKPGKVLKLYRRIWWGLYLLDIFHVFVNTRRSRLFEDTPAIKPRTEDDWEAEDLLGTSSGLLSAVTPQQKASPVVHCELSRIFGQCLSIVTNKPQHDPRQMMHPLDEWRRSLAAKMHVNGNSETDMYYLNIQAMSYRFECILCRLVRRCWQRSRHPDWSEWAHQRLRSAILELDTIAMRVLASDTLQNYPISFITTMTALLALHIESALDPAETDLVHSTTRISISQTMLLLSQGKDIPALKRALPVFEGVLSKLDLYSTPSNTISYSLSQSQIPQDNRILADACTSSHTQASLVSSQLEQGQIYSSLDAEFLGFDFLDGWQHGQLDFAGQH